MEHEKTIFLQECLEAIWKRTAYSEGVINGVQLMQEIILRDGDIVLNKLPCAKDVEDDTPNDKAWQQGYAAGVKSCAKDKPGLVALDEEAVVKELYKTPHTSIHKPTAAKIICQKFGTPEVSVEEMARTLYWTDMGYTDHGGMGANILIENWINLKEKGRYIKLAQAIVDRLKKKE